MIFNKKNLKCENCRSKIEGKFSFCPYCGMSLIDEEKYAKEYGFLGKGDEAEEEMQDAQLGMGITDKLIGSLMNSLMKSLDKQFRQMEKGFEKAEIKTLPNGIRIQIGPHFPQKKVQKSIFEKPITEKQLERMNVLPREKAETKIKRLSDKVICELDAPGIISPQDVFISKLESGYEIKAIANDKIYVNSLPINLPLKSLSLSNNKLLVEFRTAEH